MSQKSHKQSKSHSLSPVKQHHKTHTAVSAFDELPPYGAMPKLDNIGITTVIEKLNEYYNTKTQCEINSVIIKNLANFLAIYIIGFQSGDEQDMETEFKTSVFDNSVYGRSDTLINALGIDVENLRSSVKAWVALHKKCIALMSSYADKAVDLEPRILALQAKLKELNTPQVDNQQTHLGGGRRKTKSLKKK
jgi:hypothetical protein